MGLRCLLDCRVGLAMLELTARLDSKTLFPLAALLSCGLSSPCRRVGAAVIPL